MNVMKYVDGDDREIAWDHEAQYIISEQPNEETSAYEFWRRLYLHAEVWGNGYAYIRRQGRKGKLLEMVNMLPDRTKPVYKDGELYYLTEVGGEMVSLFKWEIFHLKGISIENALGLDIVDKARNTLGLAMAAQGFASKFFSNGSQAGGILTVPPDMPNKAIENIEEGFRKCTTSKENWFKTVLLRDGATFQMTTIDAEKSQLGETSERQVREIARILNMPGFKLNLEDSQAYNSAETAQLVYITSCLSHRLAAARGEAKSKLLSEQERRARKLYIAHNIMALIEVDLKSKEEVLVMRRQNLIINANEYRREIGMNKRTDPGGNDYVNPNTSKGEVPPTTPDAVPDTGKTPEEQTDGEPAGLENRVRTQIESAITESVNRASRRMANDARKAAKSAAKFVEYLDSRANDSRSVVDEILTPQVGMAAAVLGGDGDALLCHVSGKLFLMLLDGLNDATKAPHKDHELPAKVDAECNRFESAAPAAVLSLIFPKG